MANGPTTFFGLTAAQFAARLAAGFPSGWSSPEAISPGPPSGNVYKTLVMFGAELSFELGALTYALDATRLATAQNGALDAASVDYFGSFPGLYALPRFAGESDSAYLVRIEAAMLPTGATRQAISDAVQAVTGVAPRLVEWWRPSDTGVYGNAISGGMMFYSVDTRAKPGRYTAGGPGGLPYQGFCQSTLPVTQPFGPNPTPAYSAYTMNYSVAGSSFFDPPGSVPLGEQQVYDAINRNKVFGTVVWVQFVPSIP